MALRKRSRYLCLALVCFAMGCASQDAPDNPLREAAHDAQAAAEVPDAATLTSCGSHGAGPKQPPCFDASIPSTDAIDASPQDAGERVPDASAVPVRARDASVEQGPPPDASFADASPEPVFALSPGCSECTNVDCVPQLSACNDAVNGTKCIAALSCISTTGCAIDGDPTNCLCGTQGADPFDCAGGAANGDCLSEFGAAASDTPTRANVLNTLLRFSDTNYALGDAVALLSCQYAGPCAEYCQAAYP